MGQLDAMLKIVAAAHDACFDEDAWTICLGRVADLLGSNGVVLALEDRGRAFTIGFEAMTAPESRSAYLGEFHAIDPVIAFGRRAPVGRSYSDDMAIQRSALERSRFHADFARRFDYCHCIQAFTHRNEGSSGFFVAARSPRAEPFGHAERALLDQLIPHLEQALRLRAMLQRADQRRVTALETLDELSEGVILVDDQLTIVFANLEAQRLLRARDGLAALGSKLAAATASETSRLRRGIGQACSGALDDGPSMVPIGRPPPKRPLFLRIATLSAAMADQFGERRAGACLFVRDPDRPWHAEVRVLRAALGLTSAEARVASLLAAGLDLNGIVSHLRTSTSTARTHLKHIFAKTDTSRQAELVALINSIPRGRTDRALRTYGPP